MRVSRWSLETARDFVMSVRHDRYTWYGLVGAAAVDGDQDGPAARGVHAAGVRAGRALVATALALQLPAFVSARGKRLV